MANEIEKKLLYVTRLMAGYDAYASGTIMSATRSEIARQSYDIYQVARVAIAHNFPDLDDSFASRVRSPLRYSRTDPLPEIEQITTADGEKSWKLRVSLGHIEALALSCDVFASMQRGDLHYLASMMTPAEDYCPSDGEMMMAGEFIETITQDIFGTTDLLPVDDEKVPEVTRIAMDICVAFMPLEQRSALSSEGIPQIVRILVPDDSNKNGTPEATPLSQEETVILRQHLREANERASEIARDRGYPRHPKLP